MHGGGRRPLGCHVPACYWPVYRARSTERRGVAHGPGGRHVALSDWPARGPRNPAWEHGPSAGDTWHRAISGLTEHGARRCRGPPRGTCMAEGAGGAYPHVRPVTAGDMWSPVIRGGHLPPLTATYPLDCLADTWQHPTGLAHAVLCSGHVSSPGSFGRSSWADRRRFRAPESWAKRPKPRTQRKFSKLLSWPINRPK